jgi:hypothetical protein
VLWCLVCRVLQSQSGRHCGRRFARRGRGRHCRWSRRHAAETTKPPAQQRQQRRWYCGSTAASMVSQSGECRVNTCDNPPHTDPTRCACRFRRDANQPIQRHATPETRENQAQSTAHDPVESIAVTHRKNTGGQAMSGSIPSPSFFCVALVRTKPAAKLLGGSNVY